MSDEQIQAALKNLSAWEYVNGELRREFKFDDFHETMRFVNAVADIAHASDHHPDMEVSYNRCVVKYSTHSAGGITQLDFDSAKRAGEL